MCGYLSYYYLSSLDILLWPVGTLQMFVRENPRGSRGQTTTEIILFNTEITLFTDLSDKNWAEP